MPTRDEVQFHNKTTRFWSNNNFKSLHCSQVITTCNAKNANLESANTKRTRAANRFNFRSGWNGFGQKVKRVYRAHRYNISRSSIPVATEGLPNKAYRGRPWSFQMRSHTYTTYSIGHRKCTKAVFPDKDCITNISASDSYIPVVCHWKIKERRRNSYLKYTILYGKTTLVHFMCPIL